LGILEAAGLVEGKRTGKWVFYELVYVKILNLIDELVDIE
jgi:DNA-binding transcriptional ArsR family regulator